MSVTAPAAWSIEHSRSARIARLVQTFREFLHSAHEETSVTNAVAAWMDAHTGEPFTENRFKRLVAWLGERFPHLGLRENGSPHWIYYSTKYGMVSIVGIKYGDPACSGGCSRDFPTCFSLTIGYVDGKSAPIIDGEKFREANGHNLAHAGGRNRKREALLADSELLTTLAKHTDDLRLAQRDIIGLLGKDSTYAGYFAPDYYDWRTLTGIDQPGS
jgi:hypothetical protein